MAHSKSGKPIARQVVAMTGGSPVESDGRLWKEKFQSQEKLEELYAGAEKAHSDAVVLMHRGVVDVRRFGKPKRLIETMSVTKSIVNLAVGRLFSRGILASLDEPVHRFYPEWNQGRKKLITLRHLMNHTSGLQDLPATTEEIYPSPDCVQLALCAELSHDPGTHFFYSNKAVNLIAGIVERASGRKLDEFTAEEIFAPLGISDFYWMKDKAGNPYVMAGLSLFPEDLAKLGKLVLDRGRWQGEQVIDEWWFDVSLQPSVSFVPNHGLLWWLVKDVTITVGDEHIEALRRAGVPAEIAGKLDEVKGVYRSEIAYALALRRAFGPDWRAELHRLPKEVPHCDVRDGGVIGYRAEGWLGQYLYLFPKQDLVAVRLISVDSVSDEERDSFPEFDGLILDLARSLG